jgi:hypothetical protein
MSLSPCRIATLAAAALAAWLIAPGASRAGDHKIFPGSFCHQSTTDSVALEYNYSISNGILISEAPGGTESNAGSTFSCPILRDNESNTNGFKFYTWVSDFWGGDQDPELDQVTCSVLVRKSDGSGQLDWESRSTAVGATGMIKLDWGTSLNISEAFAVYSMDCWVPTYSGISSYRTDEP